METLERVPDGVDVGSLGIVDIVYTVVVSHKFKTVFHSMKGRQGRADRTGGNSEADG
jgi:hypothetical protein